MSCLRTPSFLHTTTLTPYSWSDHIIPFFMSMTSSILLWYAVRGPRSRHLHALCLPPLCWRDTRATLWSTLEWSRRSRNISYKWTITNSWGCHDINCWQALNRVQKSLLDKLLNILLDVPHAILERIHVPLQNLKRTIIPLKITI